MCTSARAPTLRAPSTTEIFNRNRDMQPDRGCCWWSTHTLSDRSVQSFSVESQFSDSNNVGPRLWWSTRPPNIRKFWSTATCKLRCWLRLLEPIHGKFGRSWRWKLRLRLKIAVVDGALYSLRKIMSSLFKPQTFQLIKMRLNYFSSAFRFIYTKKFGTILQLERSLYIYIYIIYIYRERHRFSLVKKLLLIKQAF